MFFYSDVYYAPTIDCFYSKCHLPIMFGLNSGRIFGNHWGCHGNGSRHDIFPIRNPAEMGFIGNVLFFVYPFFKPTGKSPKSVQEKRGHSVTKNDSMFMGCQLMVGVCVLICWPLLNGQVLDAVLCHASWLKPQVGQRQLLCFARALLRQAGLSEVQLLDVV